MYSGWLELLLGRHAAVILLLHENLLASVLSLHQSPFGSGGMRYGYRNLTILFT